jgi:hypothetical protein
VSSADAPLHARALFIERGHVKLALVTFDLLMIPHSIAELVHASAARFGADATWVVATHTHTSFGGYDASVLAQLVGTGRYRERNERVILHAASAALEQAQKALGPVKVSAGSAETELVAPRSGDTADRRLSRLLFHTPAGPVAEIVIHAAHPTLEPRQPKALHPDYPGLLSDRREKQVPLSLFLQGAVGNATVAVHRDDTALHAEKVDVAINQLTLAELSGDTLGIARARVPLPRPDARRLVPRIVGGPGDNFLCRSAPRSVEVSAIALGPLVLLAIPGEPTYPAMKALLDKTHADRVVSLVNGYVGYVEEPDFIRRLDGEAHRQFFGPTLLEKLTDGAALAVAKVREPATGLTAPEPPQ